MSRSVKTFQKENGKFNVDGSLSDLIAFHCIKNESASNTICKNLLKDLKINEQAYYTVCVRSFAEGKEWNDVNTYIQMRTPPCPQASIGEVCNEFNNHELAQEAFKKVKDAD
jgi:hypothetical protein